MDSNDGLLAKPGTSFTLNELEELAAGFRHLLGAIEVDGRTPDPAAE
jgi:hypothetical protein